MNISKLIFTNIINFIVLGLVIVIMQLFSMPVALCCLAVWIFLVIYTNYNVIYAKTDWGRSLQRADRGAFRAEVSQTINLIQSLEDKKTFFETFDESDKIRETYELVYRQFYVNVDYIIKYMKTYDYVLQDVSQKQRIVELVNQNTNLVLKLNDLVEGLIAMNQSVDNVDTSIVDDLVNSLQTMAN